MTKASCISQIVSGRYGICIRSCVLYCQALHNLNRSTSLVKVLQLPKA